MPKLLHKKSQVEHRIPSAAILDFGEIAVNYNENDPFLSIRTSGSTSDSKMATFPSSGAVVEIISSELDPIKEKIDKLVNITYLNLKSLRDKSQLIPGQQYRITDYITTTTQTDTSTAGHQFDVIVTADDEKTLNENARAIQHEGNTYFSNSNLAAWELKYCLDNDTSRFIWANATNGKGVIYYMKDEFNNECPYDFKNILFKRYKTTSAHEALVNDKSKIEDYIGYKPTTYWTENLPAGLTIISDNDYKWYYTFNALVDTVDLTLTKHATSNIIRPEFPGDTNNTIQTLNNIVFRCTDLYNNFFETGCYNMTFLISQGTVFCNIFGQYLRSNIFVCESGFYQNKIGDNCQLNIFIGSLMGYNDIGHYAQRNIIISPNFIRNTIAMRFVGNTIIGIAQDNTIGTYCSGNTIESYEEDNAALVQSTIGTSCMNCRFKRIVNCIIGQRCQNNIIKRLSNSQIGIGFMYNTFKTSNDLNSSDRPYIRGCTFGDSICYNNFYNSSTGSSSNSIQNLRVQSYLQGTSATKPNHIEVPVASVGEIMVLKNSDGDIKVFCLADLIA